jgi:lipoyl(octanoyl) transferase
MLVFAQTNSSGAVSARRTGPLARRLGVVAYASTYDAMRSFNTGRTAATPDELWVLEHPPVYTAGIAARAAHFPRSSAIPLVRVDRGGQITYHGPGQAIVYTLVDLERRHLTVSGMVALIEDAVIGLLAERGAAAQRKPGAPGVYVEGAKIAALGLRVRRGCCYHGVALNVAMDLRPFERIDPCGHAGLRTIDLSTIGVRATWDEVASTLGAKLANQLSP